MWLRKVPSSNPRRRFYFLLAIVVGISIGFMLTSPLRSGSGSFTHVSVAGNERSVADTFVSAGCGVLEEEVRHGRVKVTRASTTTASSTDEEVPRGVPGPPGPNDRVLEILRNSDRRRRLILVGVMTAQKYLDTRAMAVYNTWAQTLAGHVIFFTSSQALASPELPLVRLPTVDDTYPPQKKSFLMLKYMHDHFVDRYEWFMRADDDVYVRTDRLENFLRSVNSSRPQFIGQAGTGNKEEFGQLHLEADENFCMGGPGIVFSRETLRLMAPNVKHCLKNLYSTHEDVEVGRCVRTFVGIPCTWSYEMQTIFYHNSSGNEAFTGNLKQREIQQAITLHPVKQHHYFYRLHNYFLTLRLREVLQTNIILQRDLRTAMTNLNLSPESSTNDEGESKSSSWVSGLQPSLTKSHPRNDSEVLKWDFIHRAIYSYSHSNPRRRMDLVLNESLDDVVNQIMGIINRFSKQRGRVIDYKDILYAYNRVDPRHGTDYILDMLLVYKKYRGRKMTFPVRKHVYVQQTFTELQVQQVVPCLFTDQNFQVLSYDNERKKINFVLPLSGRWKTFRRFMTNFEVTCLVHRMFPVSLTVVLFPDSSSDEPLNNRTANDVKSLLSDLESKYQDFGPFSLVQLEGAFSRAVALQTGSSRFGPDELLLFIDVDMHFDRHFLHRVCANTVRGKQVYFPIVFSQYDPSLSLKDVPNWKAEPEPPVKNYEDAGEDGGDLFLIHPKLGYWRVFGFGIVSLYNGDLRQVGGLDTGIRGWGQEDVDLYDKVIRSRLRAFRAADPGLVHVFHPVECDEKLSPTQMTMCQGSRASSYANIATLAQMIYDRPELIQNSHVGKMVDEEDAAVQR